MGHQREEQGVSWVCILGAIVLVMGVWFLTLPRADQYDALEYWKGTGAKPKPKPKPMAAKPMAAKPMAPPVMAPPAAKPMAAKPMAAKPMAAKPRAGVRVMVKPKPKAAPMRPPSKTTP